MLPLNKPLEDETIYYKRRGEGLKYIFGRKEVRLYFGASPV